MREGGFLSMEVDLSVPCITFVNKNNHATRTLPLAQHYQQQKAYVFVQINGEDGSVSVEQN